VRGEPRSEAVAELLGAGVDPARVTVTRLADDSPEGAVIRQTDTTCEDPILLVVSDGGPVVDVDELSAGLQQSLAAGPGDVPDVVRRIDTDAGPVYKSDTTMVGDLPRGGGYAIRRSDHDVEVVAYLVRPRRSTLEVPSPPVGSERLDELARELLDVALTL
jgi:hypothetical protein